MKGEKQREPMYHCSMKEGADGASYLAYYQLWWQAFPAFTNQPDVTTWRPNRHLQGMTGSENLFRQQSKKLTSNPQL